MARGQTQRFSDEVEAALKAVLPSDDPLDQPDFDPVEYINSRFQTERSLDGLDSFIVEVRQKLRASEGRLLDAVKVQATTASKAADDLKSAKTAVEELHQRVTDIKTKAEASENMVSGICDSIRHLDTAKANLSKSIKTLNNLQLYIRNIHNLGIAIEAKEWSSVNTSLRQAQDFRTKFKPFEETPKIRELADKLTQHEKQLEFQLCSSVIRDLQANEANKNEEALREACLVVDALGQETVSKFRQKFISALLEPYAAMFRKNTEDAAFEKTERRFIFIKQILENKKSLFWNVFPRGWSVAQELCVDFCLRTNKEISAHLREETDIDIAVLVYILQRTIEFEKELTIRMRTLQAEIDEEQLGNGAPAQQLSEYRYYGLIVKCFDSHMDKYVLHEGELLEKTVAQSIESDSVVEDLLVLQSSQDVFLCIQESSSRSARFASEPTMAELARVWLKNLRNYTQHLMQRVATAPQGPSACEDYCIIINSADFCRGATEGIGVDLTKSAESEVATLVSDIEGTMDGFAKLSTTANQQLVDGFCQRLQPVLAELQAYLAVISGGGNSDSAHLEGSAFDESAASKKLRREYTEIVRLAAKSLQPHCFPFLLNRFASTFISKFWAMALYRPKARHSDLSISQLLIDCKALENMFLSVPNEVINAAAKSHTQFSRASVLGAANKPGTQNDGPRIHLATYTKTVKREIGYLSMALKVLQLPAGDGFVQLYHQITPQEKRSLTDCTRLLDLKGVKPEDTRQLIALLKKRADVPVTTPRDALYETAQKSSVLSGIFSSRDDAPSASSPSAGRPSAQRRSEDPGNGESGNQEESAWKRLRGAAALAFNTRRRGETRD